MLWKQIQLVLKDTLLLRLPVNHFQQIERGNEMTKTRDLRSYETAKMFYLKYPRSRQYKNDFLYFARMTDKLVEAEQLIANSETVQK